MCVSMCSLLQREPAHCLLADSRPSEGQNAGYRMFTRFPLEDPPLIHSFCTFGVQKGYAQIRQSPKAAAGRYSALCETAQNHATGQDIVVIDDVYNQLRSSSTPGRSPQR